MIVDAITRVRNIDKNNKVIDIFSPKYQYKALTSLHADNEGKPVKLVTGWKDIPINLTPGSVGSVCINGSTTKDDDISKIDLTRGMNITCFGDDTIYICMPEVFLK